MVASSERWDNGECVISFISVLCADSHSLLPVVPSNYLKIITSSHGLEVNPEPIAPLMNAITTAISPVVGRKRASFCEFFVGRTINSESIYFTLPPQATALMVLVHRVKAIQTLA